MTDSCGRLILLRVINSSAFQARTEASGRIGLNDCDVDELRLTVWIATVRSDYILDEKRELFSKHEFLLSDYIPIYSQEGGLATNSMVGCGETVILA